MYGESNTLYRDGDDGGPARRKWWRVALIVLFVLLLACSAALSVTYGWAEGKVRHTAALADYPGRPAQGKGTNWLIVGTDTRAGLNSRQRAELHVGGGGQRSTDSVMVLHYGEAGPYLVSIPRDSYVTVPGHGRAKINSAYASGGPRLLTRTVERATGLRLDHYAEIDFLGFTRVVDALDGVRICLAKPLRDNRAGADLRSGCQTLGGEQALAFVRARHSDPKGDLGRVKRQRRLLSALVGEGTSPATMGNPFRFFPFLGSALGAITVDKGSSALSLTRMGWTIRRLTEGAGGTTTVPVANPGLSVAGAGSVVAWEPSGSRSLFHQLRQDVPITATPVK